MEAVRKAGHEPVDMGYHPDRHVEPSDVDRDELASCDVYIGIFGLRWGTSCPSNPDNSYTIEEYELALERQMPQYIFMLDENSAELGISGPDLGYNEPTYGLQIAFRDRVKSKVTRFIKRPIDLREAIANALADASGRPKWSRMVVPKSLSASGEPMTIGEINDLTVFGVHGPIGALGYVERDINSALSQSLTDATHGARGWCCL